MSPNMTGLVTNKTIEALSDLCRDVFRPVPGVERKVTGAIAAMCSQDRYICDPTAASIDEEFCRLADELGTLLSEPIGGLAHGKSWKLWNALKSERSVEKGCKALSYIINEKRKDGQKEKAGRKPAGEDKVVASTPFASQMTTPGFPTQSCINYDQTTLKSSLKLSKIGGNSVQHQRRFYQDQPVSLSPSPTGESLCQAIVSATMGYESDLFTFDPKTKELKITGENRFDPPFQNLFHQLGKIGQWHNVSRTFVDATLEGSDSPFRKAFAAAVLRYLQQFYNHARLVDTPPTIDDPDERKLKRLTYWFEPYGDKLRVLAEMVTACGKLQGGALLSRLHRFCMTGDPGARRLCFDVLSRACSPLYDFIFHWLVEGKVVDNHQEFFIRQDGAAVWCADETRLDDWWGQKYLVRPEEVPVFFSGLIVEDILAVGKNVLFAANVCRQVDPIPGMKELYELFKRDVKPESLFLEGLGEMGSMRDANNQLYSKEGEYLGALVYKMANLSSSYVYHHLVLKECGLVSELVGLRQLVLLGSGEFTHSLINWMRSVLELPAAEVTLPMVRGPLENALKEVFSGYSSAARATKSYSAITERVDVKLFDASGLESGWDIFVLYYRIDGPLRAIITQQHMTYYSQLFRCLWKMQRTSFVTKKLWMEVKNARKMFPLVPEIIPAVRDILVLVSAMSHMVKELYFFLSSEVIDTEWTQMMSKVEAANSLDEVAEAHTGFLEAVFRRDFLKDANTGMFPRLLRLQALIIGLYPIVMNFIDSVSAENERRAKDVVVKPKLPPKKAGLGPGGRGMRATITKPPPPVKAPTPVKLTEKEKLARLTFQSACIESCRGKVEVISDEFMSRMCDFLMELAKDNDASLLPLSMRLDFNEFFAARDRRLGTPLTLRNQLERSLTLTNSRSKLPGSVNLFREIIGAETPIRGAAKAPSRPMVLRKE